AAIDWSAWLKPGGSLRVDAQTKDSVLDHSRFLEQRVKDAIVDQLRDAQGERPSVDKESPDLRVHLHVWRNRATLSLDSSGPSLHKRGWRTYQGRAPLAETLASAMTFASGWNRRAPVLDPFCGSGTLLVEAAWMAAGRAPGLLREHFAFESWPNHDKASYRKLHAQLTSEAGSLPRKLRLIGRDIDPEKIEGARENAERAGLSDNIQFEVGDASDMDYRPGWNAQILTNPPYGERVGDEGALVEVYQAFGSALRERASGYDLCLLSGNPHLLEALQLDRRIKSIRDEWRNGSLECELLRAKL
ncbi:MAG: 23S rRNA (guanine2445-N2)-methyltransferase / 23S rRNA (guanine2069-N7)-methyltransferase, partial [Planctomycetota bacterium]